MEFYKTKDPGTIFNQREKSRTYDSFGTSEEMGGSMIGDFL